MKHFSQIAQICRALSALITYGAIMIGLFYSLITGAPVRECLNVDFWVSLGVAVILLELPSVNSIKPD